jgi:6-phosphogluconolactonase
MSNVALRVVEDEAAFVEACAGIVVEEHARAVAAKGAFVLALTGGSTPIPVHRALASAPWKDRIDWSRVHVLFGDERAVPPSDPRSNFGAAKRDLLDHVPIPPSNVHRMIGESTSLDDAARTYEGMLGELCDARIDLVFVGLGKDAHVFSLFPGSPMIGEQKRLVVAELDPPMDPAVSRITFTPPMIDRAVRVLGIAAGANKADAMKRAVEGADDPSHVPAHVLRRAKSATLVVDRAAASKLANV